MQITERTKDKTYVRARLDTRLIYRIQYFPLFIKLTQVRKNYHWQNQLQYNLYIQ